MKLIAVLLFLFAFLFLPSAMAQGIPVDGNNIVTAAGVAWFALVTLVASLGVPVTTKAVDFILKRKWKWVSYITGDWIILLSFVFALGWTLFIYQPGILNLASLSILPAWQSILAISVIIAVAASGGKDGETLKMEKKKEIETGTEVVQ